MGFYGLVYGVILGALLHLANPSARIDLVEISLDACRWSAAPRLMKVLRMLGPRVAHHVLSADFLYRARQSCFPPRRRFSYGLKLRLVHHAGTRNSYRLSTGYRSPAHSGRDLLQWRSQSLRKDYPRCNLGSACADNPCRSSDGCCYGAFDPNLLRFDGAGSQLVLWVTRAYLLGLCGHALLETATRSFYAQQDARTLFSLRL